MYSLADSAQSGGLNPAVTILIVLAGIAFYCLPLIIAIIRRVPNVGSVAVVNLLLGWFLGVGWVIALAMAVRSKPAPQYLYAPERPQTSQPPGR